MPSSSDSAMMKPVGGFHELFWSASNVAPDSPPENTNFPPAEKKWARQDGKLSKTLCYVLRHGAVVKDVPIRPDGYCKLSDLVKVPELAQCLDLVSLLRVVRFNAKRRYSIALPSEKDCNVLEDVNAEAFIDVRQMKPSQREALTERLYVRALQGHSMDCIDTRLLYVPIRSPEEIPVCVHGTYWCHWKSVLHYGLRRMARLHIHFARGLPGEPDVVSGIRGNAEVAIYIDVKQAMEDGIEFWLSRNNVILSEGIDGVLAPRYFSKAVSLPDRCPVPLNPDAIS